MNHLPFSFPSIARLGRVVQRPGLLPGIVLLLAVGCHGPNDWARNHAASATKVSIDSAIQREVRKDSPYRQEPYSPAAWSEYWNSRIHGLHELERSPEHPHYRGPSARDFAGYIVATRRTNGLPELVVEERNRGRIP